LGLFASRIIWERFVRGFDLIPDVPDDLIRRYAQLDKLFERARAILLEYALAGIRLDEVVVMDLHEGDGRIHNRGVSFALPLIFAFNCAFAPFDKILIRRKRREFGGILVHPEVGAHRWGQFSS